jgi:hypothetical protein
VNGHCRSCVCDLGGIFSLYNEEDVCTAYEFNTPFQTDYTTTYCYFLLCYACTLRQPPRGRPIRAQSSIVGQALFAWVCMPSADDCGQGSVARRKNTCDAVGPPLLWVRSSIATRCSQGFLAYMAYKWKERIKYGHAVKQ